MKRLLACVISVVLVVGLMPTFAVAEDGSGSIETSDFGSGYYLAGSALGGIAAQAVVNVTLEDANLYGRLVEQFAAQGVSCTADESAQAIAIDPDEAAKVVELDLSYASIANLEGIGALRGFPNLTKIDLSHNALVGSAAAPLSELVQLAYLDLYENKLDNWTFLSELVNLEHLNLGLSKRGGATREALKNLTKLKWLDFSFPDNDEPVDYNYIVDCVSGLEELEYLDLCGWYINDLNGTGSVPGGMGNLKKLKTLVMNYNYVKDLTPLLPCAQLEELYVAYNRMYWGHDKGVGNLIADDGSLKLAKLRKLDMWGQESRDGNPNWLEDPSKGVREQVDALYRLHKQGKLELGYDYRWIDELVAMQPHRDSSGVEYIAYEDFGTYCREGSDDFDAMRNAHQYANDRGCEVRSVVDEGAEAAKGKTYHVYRLFDRADYFAYSSVDWQGATFVIHDEEIDWHYRANKSLLTMRPSPADFAESTVRPSANTRTLEVGSTLSLDADKLPLSRDIASIKGLSPELDAAIAELNELGYSRYYVQLYDANTLRYARGYVYKYKGNPQWDALIVDGDGSVQRFNAAKLSGDETPESSYIPPDPDPLQWQFDDITKIVIAPIADTPAHIRNARFVTMPFKSKAQLPQERWNTSYLRNFEISGTNLELAHIVQTVGTAENGYDNGNYSGLYVGFLDLKDCAELNMHDVYTWQRVCTRSTYGFQTVRIMCARIKNVGDSNPVWRGGHGNHGGNYAKHMLWEEITLGRIDQHTGCYDMAVRDSDLHSLSLTGAGPLTVERTTVTGMAFFNLRGDYGSTWDGEAHVIDCTHYPIYDKSQEPDNFAASTPDLDWDFGYPQRFPELHLKDFKVDASKYTRSTGTRYRISYGIASNYLNGLNSQSHVYPGEDYWPDVLEVDGLDIRNWGSSIGYELHVLMPLYMLGKPSERVRAGAWTLKNVTYDGESFTPATFEGVDELAGPGEIAASTNTRVQADINFTDEQMDQLEKSDIAIAYTGDEPRLLMRTFKNHGEDSWISAYPYLVEHRGDVDVGYYSGRELMIRWRSVLEKFPDAGNLALLHVVGESQTGKHEEAIEGAAHVQHVRLVKTHETCQHVWGEPRYTWAADNSSCTAQRVCTLDAEHIDEEVASAVAEVTRAATCTQKGETTYTAAFSKAGFTAQSKAVDDIAVDPEAHDWGEWTVTEEPSPTSEGTETRTCTRDASHIETRSIPKTSADSSGTSGDLAPDEPAASTDPGISEPGAGASGSATDKSDDPVEPAAGGSSGSKPPAASQPSSGMSGIAAPTTSGASDVRAASKAKALPVYQLYKKKTHDRFLTTRIASVRSYLQRDYVCEGVAMYSVAKSANGAKRVYHYKKGKKHRYLTGSKLKGYTRKGTAFYMPGSGKKCYEWKKKVAGALEYKYAHKKPAPGWKKTGKYLYGLK